MRTQGTQTTGEVDTLILGGGLAGLAAAERLLQAGGTVAVLEARNRLGGRVWTVPDRHVGTSVELGAEWIGGSGAVHDILARQHVELREAEGQRWRRVHGCWENLRHLPLIIQEFLSRAKPHTGTDRPLGDVLRVSDAAAERHDTPTLVRAYAEGFHAADPERLSFQWLTQVEETQPADASELRARGGAGRIVDALAAALDGNCEIRLQRVAGEVRWRPGAVEVISTGDHGATECYKARSAIITVPLPVLKTLRCTPDLPHKREAADRLEMGPVVKLVLRFREPFWREIGPLRDLLFLHAFDQPFPTWWTAPDPADPLLTAWAGGSQAVQLGDTSEQGLIELAIASLAHALGVEPRHVAKQLDAQYFHDWRSDPFAMGAYTYVAVGGMDAYRTLARPVTNTLFFAGEATCGAGFNATMEGAVQSGRRAAEEVLRTRPGMG